MPRADEETRGASPPGRDETLDRGHEERRIDRLRQIFGRAGGLAGLAIFLPRFGRQRDDRK
jgi:hypothetical protein